jgi:hypothetical protein
MAIDRLTADGLRKWLKEIDLETMALTKTKGLTLEQREKRFEVLVAQMRSLQDALNLVFRDRRQAASELPSDKKIELKLA